MAASVATSRSAAFGPAANPARARKTEAAPYVSAGHRSRWGRSDGCAAETIAISGVTIGLTAPEVQELIKAAAASAVGPLTEKIMDLSLRLGVTQGAMRTLLATIGQADVSDDRLIDKLTEVVTQYGKASAAIVALRPDNPAAQQHVARASEAAALGDQYQARQHLQAARAAAEAAAADAQRLAREAEAAAAKQMLQAAQAVAAEAELSLAALDYLEAAT